MMESIDLSVSFTASGKFIELHKARALPKVQPVWSRYCRSRRNLECVKARLSSCNEPSSLLQFARKCQQQNKDFEKELRRLARSVSENSSLVLPNSLEK